MKRQLPKFSDLHILVIGDIMLDVYQHGSVTRMSPEGPIPIFRKEGENIALGGAGNVAKNLTSLGATVSLISAVGDDESGAQINRLLSTTTGIDQNVITVPNRKTTTKTRIIAQNRQVLRIDYEDTDDLEFSILKEIFDDQLISQTPNGVVLQDYNKGVLSPKLIEYIISTCTNLDIPMFVDPKEKNLLSYKNCTIFKPNLREAKFFLGNATEDPQEIVKQLFQLLNCKIIVLTLGEEGVALYDGDQYLIQKAQQRNVVDVCGAGDAAVSMMTLSYLKNYPIDDLANLVNIAGGLVCEQFGVAVVDLKKLEKEFENLA